MSQDEIVGWLRERRLAGSCAFFSIAEIKIGLSVSGFSAGARIYEQCVQLYRFGVLEVRRKGVLITGYRLRRKYMGIEGEV